MPIHEGSISHRESALSGSKAQRKRQEVPNPMNEHQH